MISAECNCPSLLTGHLPTCSFIRISAVAQSLLDSTNSDLVCSLPLEEVVSSKTAFKVSTKKTLQPAEDHESDMDAIIDGFLAIQKVCDALRVFSTDSSSSLTLRCMIKNSEEVVSVLIHDQDVDIDDAIADLTTFAEELEDVISQIFPPTPKV